MLFAEALRSALFGVFSYSGRSDRLEQWTFMFLTAILGGVFAMLVKAGLTIGAIGLLVALFVVLWLLLAHIALFIRRLHDQDRSGFFMSIPLIGVSLMLASWVGQSAHGAFMVGFFQRYGWLVAMAGRSISIISFSMLLGVFVGEGTDGPNRYGDPV